MRIRSALNAYKIARSFKVGAPRAAWLALRFLLTGRTGRYRLGIGWRDQGLS